MDALAVETIYGTTDTASPMSSRPCHFPFFRSFCRESPGCFFSRVSSPVAAIIRTRPRFTRRRRTVRRGLVRYGATLEEARSLDPQVAYDQMSRVVLEPVYDTLLEYRPMKTDPYEVVPGLLAGMPERTVNPDGGVTYLCRLKKGVMFQDDPCFPHGKGRELVAQDVHYAWQRMCDPKVECPVLSTFQESVAGMAEA